MSVRCDYCGSEYDVWIAKCTACGASLTKPKPASPQSKEQTDKEFDLKVKKAVKDYEHKKRVNSVRLSFIFIIIIFIFAVIGELVTSSF